MNPKSTKTQKSMKKYGTKKIENTQIMEKKKICM
jgi:hypothetical protein